MSGKIRKKTTTKNSGGKACLCTRGWVEQLQRKIGEKSGITTILQNVTSI